MKTSKACLQRGKSLRTCSDGEEDLLTAEGFCLCKTLRKRQRIEKYLNKHNCKNEEPFQIHKDALRDWDHGAVVHGRHRIDGCL